MRRYLVLGALALFLAGCSSSKTQSTATPRSGERLPPEVVLSPEEAAKKQGGRTSSRR